jgi:hypothetical protein
MKLVVAASGLRHLVSSSADGYTLCGRECSSWEDAFERRMSDVRPHEHCVSCWYSASRAGGRFDGESWPDGTSVYPLNFGKGGYVAPDEVMRLRETQAELDRTERKKMREVIA